MSNFLSIFGLGLLLASLSFAGERQSGKIVGKGKEPLRFSLSAPQGGWTVDRMVEVAGQVSDPTVNPVTVNINGARYLLRADQDGSFKRKFPANTGKNVVIVSGSNSAGFAEERRTFFARIDPVALMAILTSDTDGVYTDLHIYEPNTKVPIQSGIEKENFVHVYWAMTASPTGGAFYLNEQGGDFDQPGYGPYLYTHRSPPVGIYRIDSNYWPSGDKGHTVGTLDLILFGGTPGEIRRKIQTPLAMPGETSTLAWVKIEKGQLASVYAPMLDPKPAPGVWPDWVLASKPRKKGGVED